MANRLTQLAETWPTPILTGPPTPAPRRQIEAWPKPQPLSWEGLSAGLWRSLAFYQWLHLRLSAFVRHLGLGPVSGRGVGCCFPRGEAPGLMRSRLAWVGTDKRTEGSPGPTEPGWVSRVE
ncbi:unknown protein [Waddlia chondrophila 2032/99]|uniref:Uncharacterized protein n=1 Tax=Waddlia chondrophila 2032/99 TaxID=765953 RepID=F8LAD3_9BACT|nr:unknown protein [Waddlia chondrophila 2032/99]